jgi:protein-tyrosine phosphatase
MAALTALALTIPAAADSLPRPPAIAPRDLFNLPLHDGPFLVDCRAKAQYTVTHIASSVCYCAFAGDSPGGDSAEGQGGAYGVIVTGTAKDFWKWVNDNAPVDNYEKVVLIFEDENSEGLARALADTLLKCDDLSGGAYRSPVRATSAQFIHFAAFAERYPFYLNTSLEVLPTYPTEVFSNLFLSGVEPARKKAMFDHLGITHVVNCASFKEPNHFEDQGIVYLRLHIVDDEGQTLDKAFQAVLPFIANARAGEGNKVLVHCNQGKNRSAAMLVAHLISVDGEFTAALDNALEYVRAVRPLPGVLSNGSFVEQLRTLRIATPSYPGVDASLSDDAAGDAK